MKHFSKILCGTLLLGGLSFAVIGCNSSGYVEVSDGYYYGPGYRDPWFHDGPWFDSRHGYDHYDHRTHAEPRHEGGRDVYINPPRGPNPAHLPPAPRLPH